MKKINNKKIIIFSIIILLIVFLIILWSFINSDKEVINNIQEIVPEEEITDVQLRNTTIALYFINKNTGEIEIENRMIDSKKLLENPYKELLTLWINGPENNLLTNGCSSEININKIEINKNCAIIDLNEKFLEKINDEKINELKIIYCIVDTLTELTEIDSVKILINGKENIYFGNVNLSEKYFKLENNY